MEAKNFKSSANPLLFSKTLKSASSPSPVVMTERPPRAVSAMILTGWLISKVVRTWKKENKVVNSPSYWLVLRDEKKKRKTKQEKKTRRKTSTKSINVFSVGETSTESQTQRSTLRIRVLIAFLAQSLLSLSSVLFPLYAIISAKQSETIVYRLPVFFMFLKENDSHPKN